MRRNVSMLLMFLLGVLLLLSACEERQESLPETATEEFKPVGVIKYGIGRYEMVKDVRTGCLYIDLRTGFSPYYDENGNVKGCKGNGLAVQP